MTDDKLPPIEILNKVLRLDDGQLVWRERHVDMTLPLKIGGRSIPIAKVLYALEHGEWPRPRSGAGKYERREVAGGSVFPRPERTRWTGSTVINGHEYTLGVYDTPEAVADAIKAVRQSKGLDT